MAKSIQYFMIYPYGIAKVPMDATTDTQAKKAFDDERVSTLDLPMSQPIGIRKVTTEDIATADVVLTKKAEDTDGLDPTTLGPIPEAPKPADQAGDPTTQVDAKA